MSDWHVSSCGCKSNSATNEVVISSVCEASIHRTWSDYIFSQDSIEKMKERFARNHAS